MCECVSGVNDVVNFTTDPTDTSKNVAKCKKWIYL